MVAGTGSLGADAGAGLGVGDGVCCGMIDGVSLNAGFLRNAGAVAMFPFVRVRQSEGTIARRGDRSDEKMSHHMVVLLLVFLVIGDDWIIFTTNKRKCYSSEIQKNFTSKQGISKYCSIIVTELKRFIS